MCTGVRFADEDGNMYFGRNLDWSFSYGEKIVVTPRGYKTPVAFNATVADPKPVIHGCRHHRRRYADVFRLRQ